MKKEACKGKYIIWLQPCRNGIYSYTSWKVSKAEANACCKVVKLYIEFLNVFKIYFKYLKSQL